MKNKENIIIKIIKLVEDFIEKKIDGKEYENRFLKIWDERVTVRIGGEKADIIDDLFGDVDRYECDPKLLDELRKEDSEMARQGMYLDEDQLRELAKKKLEKLKKMMKKH